MAGFAELLSKKINALQTDIQKAQKAAMREALKEGAKTYKEIAKPLKEMEELGGTDATKH